MSDPREQGFNYGSGWGSKPKPPVYLMAMELARRMAKKGAQLSHSQWSLEMALRNVRLATTGVEKSVAVAELTSELRRLNAWSE